MAKSASPGLAGKPVGSTVRRNGASAAASINDAHTSGRASAERALFVASMSWAVSSAVSLAPGSGSFVLKRTARTILPSAIDEEMSVAQLARSPSTRRPSASRSLTAVSRDSSSRAAWSACVTTARRSRSEIESATSSAADARSSQSAWRTRGRRSSARARSGAAWTSGFPSAFNCAF